MKILRKKVILHEYLKVKKRVVITLENEVVEAIQKIANENMRTVSNEIALLIKEKYMNTKE